MSYNGWDNRATWNVALWVDNDEGMYRERMALVARSGGQLTAWDAERFVRDMMPDGTPDMKSAAEYDDVDWTEIAEGWNSELEVA